MSRDSVIPYYSLAELRELSVPAPVPVIGDLLNEGETVLLVGRPKVGKSLLTLQMAISLSRGEDFLGKLVPRQRGVLLIDLENRASVIKERFVRMAGPLRDTDSKINIYAPETLADCSVSLSTEDGFNKLDVLLTDTQAELVVIDTWRLLLGPKDENKSEVVVEGLRQLSQLRRSRPHLSIMIVHHLRKQNAEMAAKLKDDPYSWVENVSGHHALVGHVDRCYGIEREFGSDGGELVVFGGVARNAASTCMILEADEETLAFRVANTRDALCSLLTGTEREFYEKALKLGSFTFTELRNECGRNKKAVASLLTKAVAQGVLARPSDPKGGRYVFRAQ